MMLKNLKQKNLYSLIIILVFLIINNFFYNFYYLIKTNFEGRMNYHYGYCYKNGYGFIKNIRSKHKLSKNIPIYNPLITPDSDWFFYDSRVKKDNNKLFLLNYSLNFKNKNFIKLEINKQLKGNYKIIDNVDNCYFLERIND